MSAVNFYLDTHPNKAGECPIKMSVIIFKKRFFPTIGHSVLPDVWNGSRVSRAKYVNSKVETAAEINKGIFNLLSRFNNYVNEVKTMTSQDELRHEMKKALGIKPDDIEIYMKEKTIFDDIDQFVKEGIAVCQWASSTTQNWITFAKRLKRFKKDCIYQDFNEEGLQSLFASSDSLTDLKKRPPRNSTTTSSDS